MSGQQHAPAALYPRERPGTHCTGGWVGPRAGLEGREISPPPGFDPRTIQPVAQSLYRLSYPAHLYLCSYCNVRDQVSGPYGTASDVTSDIKFSNDTLCCISMKCHTLTFLASIVQRRQKCLFADTLSNSDPFQNKIWRHCL